MIRLVEVQEAARAWGLRPDIVEKDYVLGWLLTGLSAHPHIQAQWIFKGGTCLKKCYLETFRFSEDLDFTLTPGAVQDPEVIVGWMSETAQTVGEASGIEFPLDLIEFRVHPNPRGGITLRGKVGYRGPLQPRTAPKVRFDLTTDEIVVRPPILRSIYHPYADRWIQPVHIHCYAIEELLAEKVRAMSERGLPRDLYDIVRLFRHEAFRLDATTIREVLAQKCAHRSLPLATMESLAASPTRIELESEWANMLGHQLPALPPLESLWAELEEFFAWLEGKPLGDLSPVEDAEPSDTDWQPPDYISLPSEWGVVAPIEAIRFAGANRLRIQLDYRAQRGRSGVREVEPYSFRRSRAGHLLFYGRNVQRPRISAYRFDRIIDAKVTTQPFLPLWRVDF
jgi:predicted nucleotidyltransferase component of viral defense system